ncbi:cysteine desulfurase family protein [Mucilaginibacter gotjawali]|uniref:cysteine desulfurase n=1 Tax=Mucilaginibacter gotjawali TaxID=1550579 RepID=A0A839SC27_9SPHI|nr:cysteine desulfurase family protein [Mucilaginibacter gotjawali]MBB3054874.1 cysteine desulfurase [Mucilaginibacter gotjawali]
MKIYLDNAATTPLDQNVFEAMTPYFLNHYGNASSQHGPGREAGQALEASRATIAGLLNALPEEIVFTSGGTEADNIAIVSAVTCNHIDHVITTPFEHPAVLQTLRALTAKNHTRISYIKHDGKGNLDLSHLEYLLRTNTRNLVSVMHANNEIGNLNDIVQTGELCEKYQALFHTDTVQTMGHYRHDLSRLKVHFLAASAHKFHGPKGVGFLYRSKGQRLNRLIHGGGQESGLRAGTENIPGIVGMAKALEIAYGQMEQDHSYIQNLKYHLITRLTETLPDVQFNGNSADLNKSLYTLLSVSLPGTDTDLLRYLDTEGIAVSGGSACSGGSASHVLKALGTDAARTAIRFSFSKFNTRAELDQVAEKLAAVFRLAAA